MQVSRARIISLSPYLRCSTVQLEIHRRDINICARIAGGARTPDDERVCTAALVAPVAELFVFFSAILNYNVCLVKSLEFCVSSVLISRHETLIHDAELEELQRKLGARKNIHWK